MTAPELIETIESVGGILTLNGDRIHYELPEDAAPMLDVLRQCRDEVVRLLRGREGPQIRGKSHPDPYAVALEKTIQSGPPPMPKGVRLLQWAPQLPPVAIESWAVVNDVLQFIQTTLSQLQAAMDGRNWLAGNRSVRELVDRLEQVGVKVSVEEIK
jgi:hypothetical protein